MHSNFWGLAFNSQQKKAEHIRLFSALCQKQKKSTELSGYGEIRQRDEARKSSIAKHFVFILSILL